MHFVKAIANTRLLILITALLLVSGYAAYSTLPRAEDPIISNRFATVTTVLSGASAERIETLVTEVVENKLRELNQIKVLTSTSRPGVSIVTVELNDDITEPEPVWSQTRDKLAALPSLLPDGSNTPKFDSDHTYAFTSIIALTWKDTSDADLLILGRYAKELASRLRNLSGTEFVDEYAQPKEEILVSLDTSSAAALGRSSSNVLESLHGADAKNPAGELLSLNHRFGLEIASELDSLNRVRQVPINVDGKGHMIRLEDIATVSRMPSLPATELAYIDGKVGVIVAARMQQELRVDRWSASMETLVEQFQRDIPSNIHVDIIFDQQGYTDARMGDLRNSLLLGFALILIVLLLTLGVRAAILVAIALPLTSMLTLTLMKITGLPINQMSVTGLIVALGIMVDNAVVMVDTIQHNRVLGQSKSNATRAALKHLWLPLLGSTLTTVLAFMPIILMPGATGEFVSGIGITVCFSLIGSYLISHTLIAGFATRFLPAHYQGSHWYHTGLSIPVMSKWFEASVRSAIRFPMFAIALVLGVAITGFWSTTQLTEQFFPPSDRDMFEVQIFLPPQASIVQTSNTAMRVDDIIRTYPSVEHTNWMIGANFPSFYYNLQANQQNAPYFAQAMIKTKDFADANRIIPLIQNALNHQVPQAQILVRKLEQGPPFKAPIELRVFGNNLDTLKSIGQDIRLIMSNTQHVTHTRETLQPGLPKVKLMVNEEASQLNGITLNKFARLLQTTLIGRNSGTVLEGGESIPIRVRVSDDERENIAHLGNLRLPISSEVYSTGVSVSTLAEMELTTSRGAITRRGGQRVNTIEGYIESGVLPQSVLIAFKQALKNYTLPPGYHIEFGGESAGRNESINNLISNVFVVVTLMVLVVVMSFNSFRISSIIFSVAGLSAGLGILSVYLFNYPFGFTVIIGLLGVIGLAINAAIVILAELKARPDTSNGDNDAIVDAVMSCTRHITSTTITTVGGFIPLIIAGGGFWPPFAIAIAGGTVLTTIISFYYVPAAYRLLCGKHPKHLSSTQVTGG
ncbi:efflux RND transporter permease subunit [Vibrio nomapromontoriensis]|uniref:efflux RND transporter permease subunit n=1 Tax=Vibrio nomapromontoriensis TaxID=2910246 RepID=UPI003D0BF546